MTTPFLFARVVNNHFYEEVIFMEKIFFILDDKDGECCSFSAEGFTDDELEAIGKFGKVMSEQIGVSIKIGTEDEFYE